MPRPVALLRVIVVVLVLIASSLEEAPAQGSFRVTYNVDRTGPTHVELSGTVFNDAPTDAIDVYVTAQALNRAGRRVAQGVSWVGPISRNASAEFTAKIPVVSGATTYKVEVTSYRYVTIPQGP